MTLDLAKSAWKRVTFGDVVRNVNETVRDLDAAGVDRIIAMEHMDPGELKITRSGSTDDGTTFTRRVKPGQTLFGKRRAYQRKVAVADFAGVCSGDIYVLESKDPQELLPELLPFICQTDAFFEHAVGTSAGSLSPRTNWESLADFEFVLPSPSQQQEIVDLGNSFLIYEGSLEESARALHEAFLAATVTLLEGKGEWKWVALQNVATVERGRFSHRPRNLPQFFGGNYPFAQTGDIVASKGVLVNVSQTLSDEGLKYSKSFPAESILITIAANIGYTAIIKEQTWCTDSVVGIVPSNEIDIRFLEYFLRTKQKYLEKNVATQTAQKNINLQDLRPLLIPLPSLEQQRKVSGFLKDIEASEEDISAKRASAARIRMALLQSALSFKNV